MKPSVDEMRKAMSDLRKALVFSGIDEDGHFTVYDIEGTARVIPVAVMSIVKIRNPNESALRGEDEV